MKVALETLGCKLNQAEAELLARQFVKAGYELVARPDEADVYILNTCTVTHTADAKSRHLLRLAHRRNPNEVIIVTGCYAERAAEELKSIEGITFVVGNSEKSNLLQILQQIPQKGNSTKNSTGSPSPFRTRAFIKIQDGCRNFCAYCIVPFVRSSEVSVPPDVIIGEIKQRAAEGYQEVVLTGTRVGAYAFSGMDLKELLAHILTSTSIPRVRLSSLQPQEISPELIKLWRNSRLCPHFHLSLQSGSASVLKRMKRHYTLEDYRKTIDLIRAEVPAVAITTDVIVGFPGETEKEFEESLEFCRRMDFARIHVFPYSPRSGTSAAQMAGQIQERVKKERSQKMLALAEESARKFREHFSGELMDVLWEKQTDDGLWSGVTSNYLRVFTKSDKNLSNKLLSVEVK
ncbi:MAG: tRNA (N(6)-L-threonylcarbamoyladenosine(37)-C(2))-methylthiotransferase MtaB [Dehalococcoidales bacterium]|nr:tRNA (N(6)-L-threonylcarbamoyladenosine(37)-C(2))-methylthiotransferase MtaB [Dehalococcoidales bacterium]